MVRRRKSSLVKNGIFHASWKARSLRRNGGVFVGTTALTAGRVIQMVSSEQAVIAVRRSMARSPKPMYSRQPCRRSAITAVQAARMVRCTHEKIPTLFRSRRSRRRSKRTRSLAEQLLLRHWKERTMHQNSQLTASGGALLVVAVPCCDSLRIEEEQ